MTYVTPADVTVSASWQAHKDRNPPSKEPGTDYNTPYGTDIRMAGNGTIVITDSDPSGAEGRRLELIMDNGQVIDYLHLASIQGKYGQKVVKGQRGIAISGASGNGKDWYYGPHVHVTLRAVPGLPYAQSIDFEKYLDNNNTPAGGGDIPVEDLIKMRNLEVWTCPAWEAANQRVITNGSACQTVPAGWGQMLIQNGAEFTNFAINDDMLAAVNMTWDLGGLEADAVKAKIDDMIAKAGVKL
jgi:murein DD-endopeptidase MepM/ murein hydrolase activator NlpD